ncbi:hypothetical protein EMIHUDRAFT_251726 [Emiliania huxleyi CCMP1516]|uniref:Uncharacterized protein n=2 Tax=Emiliania huxleyi TaxID=2903 RepID=A0A0D3KSD7_EMIH1|nr:hypothetical protein EMIHUDRAFT_251726 [Emiliania huxleyi CCMP1516]EOD38672.1 hypothetical protein EMIHUDRAFT_251726 [Emiliania huxleyi CCMP1516]|eukprot:XP_005791101.1 hypothetical protein EMIHUDRAFT_251726 [Emiliania huxleyi CCMP1516]
MVVDPACAAPAVRLSRILPMMPAVSPEAAAERVVQFAADVGPSQLAWVPSSDVFTGDAEAVRSVERLAFLAGGSHGRFLLASGGGRLLLLEQDEGLEGLGGIGGRPPEWQALELLPDGALGGPLRSLCVSSTEDELFFAAGGGTPPTSLPQRNLYVCVDEGVRVFDEQGEESLVISTPAPATGVCFGRFGGSSLSTLFVGAADSIWALPTQVQGAEASRSFRFLKQIEKQVQAQRHENW